MQEQARLRWNRTYDPHPHHHHQAMQEQARVEQDPDDPKMTSYDTVIPLYCFGSQNKSCLFMTPLTFL
jgi:hypothetical protein